MAHQATKTRPANSHRFRRGGGDATSAPWTGVMALRVDARKKALGCLAPAAAGRIYRGWRSGRAKNSMRGVPACRRLAPGRRGRWLGGHAHLHTGTAGRKRRSLYGAEEKYRAQPVYESRRKKPHLDPAVE